MEKILITGNLGYIGPIITLKLLEKDYNLIGLDTEYYTERRLYESEFRENISQIKKDIRNISINDLKGIRSIIHLAALSNDPLGELNPQLTEEINYKASLNLAKLAKKAGVERFLFSSSCSIYGQTKDEPLKEDSPLNPLTTYAKSKVQLEKGLLKLADKNFSPVFLRNATAYGVSPFMRFDLVTNNLMGWAYSINEIKILSDGKAWRPIVHIGDIANAFVASLEAPQDLIHKEAFNVGVNSENYQVKDIAIQINKRLPDCEIKIIGKDNPDQRDYIVNFDKIKRMLKGYRPQWNLEKGIEELYKVFKEINLNQEIFESRFFTRLKQLKYLIDNNNINENLFWI